MSLHSLPSDGDGNTPDNPKYSSLDRFNAYGPGAAMGPNVQAIQEALSLEDYLTERGVQLKNGRCACPVHGGSNPSSFKLLGEVAHCHSCQWSGGVIKIHAALEVMEFWEALVDLSTRYGIELPGRPDSWHRKNERQKRARDAIELAQIRKYQRRIYRWVIAAHVASIQDEAEREQEAAELWEEAFRIGRLLYLGQGEENE